MFKVLKILWLEVSKSTLNFVLLFLVFFKKDSFKFLCILNGILKSQVQIGIHQNGFFWLTTKILSLITLITLLLITFRKTGKLFLEFQP